MNIHTGPCTPDKLIQGLHDQFEAHIDNCDWTWLTVHGKYGIVAKAASGFLFFPVYQVNANGYGSEGYWSSTYEDGSSSSAYHCLITTNKSGSNGIWGEMAEMDTYGGSAEFPIRQVINN